MVRPFDEWLADLTESVQDAEDKAVIDIEKEQEEEKRTGTLFQLISDTNDVIAETLLDDSPYNFLSWSTVEFHPDKGGVIARVDIWDYDPDRKNHAYVWVGSVPLTETKLVQEHDVVSCSLGPN